MGGMNMTRRSFFGAAAAAGTLAGSRAVADDAPGAFAEPAQRIPVDDWADVIVAGGGPAGVAAAVSAARAGANALQIELDPLHQEFFIVDNQYFHSKCPQHF